MQVQSVSIFESNLWIHCGPPFILISTQPLPSVWSALPSWPWANCLQLSLRISSPLTKVRLPRKNNKTLNALCCHSRSAPPAPHHASLWKGSTLCIDRSNGLVYSRHSAVCQLQRLTSCIKECLLWDSSFSLQELGTGNQDGKTTADSMKIGYELV